ncbi:sensor histidine kinase [Bacillus sp. mrc49]|uniref:sensor histidine kinase n=1 Tax=Bacillus sp. mrc49 TaxID=2054913 RepID=UPI000C2766D4|nr:HAMP domain-containing sensor histidine kinase [Bacillus sp. mrc49]PJN87576.1 sensor histidine kinase [Bacillus sp. mrc49]
MKTLYFRIVIQTILIMVLASVIAFLISNVYYHKVQKPYNGEKISKVASDIVSLYEENPSQDIDAYLNHIAGLHYQMYLFNEQGEGTLYGEPFRETALDSGTISGVLHGKTYQGIASYNNGLFITGFFDDVLINSIGVPINVDGEKHALFVRPNIELQFGEIRFFLAVLLILTLLLSFLFVIINTRFIVKPITKLTEATKRIADGDYGSELNVSRRDEIGDLAKHFSKMTQSIQRLDEMRQEFVSNVSHEIQSPLASIQGFSQTLQSEELTREQRNQYLSIIEKESRRMSLLSKQLLQLASLDKEEDPLQRSSFDLAQQIRQVMFMLEWNWREKEMVIEMDVPSIIVFADEKLMSQVWTNLITNSIKYSEMRSTIYIRLKKLDHFVEVMISDTGLGISEEDLPYILDRFYKVDKVRNRSETGSGLGLSITKKTVDLHGGTIEVQSELGKGTTFYIRLPLM